MIASPEPLVLGAILALTLALPCAGVAQVPGEATLTLVRDGQPASTVVIARQATRAAQFAAYELQWHVEKMTGALLPIVRDDEPVTGLRILVGESAATKELGLASADFRLQEYAIRFLPDKLVLMGRDKDDRGEVTYSPTPDQAALTTWPSMWDNQGTMYAVYDFLERSCGVRWLNPTETGTDCPQTKTLTFTGAEVRRAPFFRYRFAAYPSSENYDSYTGLWPGDSDGFKRWEAAAFGDLHQRFPDYWAFLHAKRGWVQLFRFRMREGGEKCVGNHSLYGYYQRFWEQDPNNPDAFVGQRADWFAQGYEGKPPQLCYTNPDLVKQIAQDARDYFDGKGINPWSLQPITDRNDVWGENYFCVEPMDNDAFCRCPRCQEWLTPQDEPDPFFSNGRHSDYFFHFVNEVAKEVGKTHPDKWIVTLAYMSHAAPPQRVNLEPNVAVQFCFACNRLNFDRPSYTHEIDLLNQWVAQEKERPLYLWLYYTFPVEIANNGKFHCFPGFFAHAVGEQFRLFEQHRLRGMFHCGYGQDVEAYVTYRLMDDPSLDVDALLDEYHQRLYGAAAEPMKQLYLAIEQTYSDPANYPETIASGRREGHHHQTEEVAWGYLGTERRMTEFGRLLQRAKDLAATDLERKRIELFELGTWDYMVAGRQLYMEHAKARYTSAGSALRVPFVSGAPLDGDPAKLDRSEAAAATSWRGRLAEPTRRKVEARMANDGRYLYLQLDELALRAAPQAADDVLAGDYWSIIVAAGRSRPYRELAVGPTGACVSREFGADAAAPAASWESGAVVASDTSPPDAWTVSVALPLDKLLRLLVPPGGSVFVNLARRQPGSDDEPVWVPTFGAFDDVTCLRELVLDPPETVPVVLPTADELQQLRKQDLVASWPLDDGAGATVADSSGHSLSGTVLNGASWVEEGGRRALRFEDARRQCVDFGARPEFDLAGPLTLEAWVRYEPTDVWYPAILGKGYEQSGAYSLHIRPGLTLWFEIDDEQGTRHFYNPTDLTLPPGAWAHVAAAYDGSVMRVYINGREAGKGLECQATIRKTIEPLRVGWLGSYGYLNGCVRNAALYSRAMSAQEVFARYLADR